MQPLREGSADREQATGDVSGRPLLERLKRFGITGWHEPLLCLPLDFADYSKASTLKDAIAQADVVGDTRIFTLVVSSIPELLVQPKRRLVLNATDGMFSVRIVVFYAGTQDIDRWRLLDIGERIYVRGALQNWNGKLQMTGPTFVDARLIGRIVPVYPKKRGVLADGVLLDATRHALEHHLDATVDHIIASFGGLSEADVLTRARLKTDRIEKILRATHAPLDHGEGTRGLAAMRRIAALSVVENAKRLKVRDPVPASVLRIPGSLLHSIVQRLLFDLTEDQLQAIREMAADMVSPYPMRRVLSGDVGSGKSLPIMVIALATQALGHRAVILTANTQLANQFASECKELFGAETNVVVVTSATRKLDLSSNPVLVGTTALLSRLKDEPPPMLLCVDEEQKLSVAQKQELAALHTNYLQATATPIPRTTALVTHGAMDVSLIRQIPVVKKITSYIVPFDQRQRLFEHTRRVIEQGGQVAIVYPLVDDEEQERKSVVSAAAEWEKAFPGLVGMVHGQMKEAEKLSAVDALKAGQHRIAVASSILEIGLTFKDLRSIIVVHAERYGISALHQFRGRVARRGGFGHFFMYLPEPVSPESMARLKLVESTSDGFALAEKDAETRGYGDLFEAAERQSGNSRSSIFRCADLTPSEIHAASNQFQ